MDFEGGRELGECKLEWAFFPSIIRGSAYKFSCDPVSMKYSKTERIDYFPLLQKQQQKDSALRKLDLELVSKEFFRLKVFNVYTYIA